MLVLQTMLYDMNLRLNNWLCSFQHQVFKIFTYFVEYLMLYTIFIFLYLMLYCSIRYNIARYIMLNTTYCARV